MGFEPTVPFGYTRSPGVPLRPLGHLSGSVFLHFSASAVNSRGPESHVLAVDDQPVLLPIVKRLADAVHGKWHVISEERAKMARLVLLTLPNRQTGRRALGRTNARHNTLEETADPAPTKYRFPEIW